MGNWKTWLKGLAAAAVNAAIGAVLPVAVNWGSQAMTGAEPEPISGGAIGLISAGAAVIGATNYLIKSPREESESK